MDKGAQEKWLKRIFWTIWIQWALAFLIGFTIGVTAYPTDENILFELRMLNDWHWSQDTEKIWFHKNRENTKFTGKDFLELNRELQYQF